jgi:hypothetical protein
MKGKVVLVLNQLRITPWRCMRDWRYRSAILCLDARWRRVWKTKLNSSNYSWAKWIRFNIKCRAPFRTVLSALKVMRVIFVQRMWTKPVYIRLACPLRSICTHHGYLVCLMFTVICLCLTLWLIFCWQSVITGYQGSKVLSFVYSFI